MVCNQVVAVYISGTSTPIEAATVTCSGHTPKTTNAYGLAEFSLNEGTTYNFRANADGYVVSDAHTITGCQDRLTIKLEEEEQIQITVKRPTWLSMILQPVHVEYPIGEELQVTGDLRVEAEPYTEGDVWLIDTDVGESITGRHPMGTDGSYVLTWTPTEYRAEGYNITVGCDAFVSGTNPLGAWSEEPNGYTRHIKVIEGAIPVMQITLPYATLLEDETVYESSDEEVACTYFNFKIRNDGDVTWSATYNVTLIGGGDLYQGTVANLAPGATSATIHEAICGLPGSLPVGTHTIKVEVRPEGEAVTDTYTEVLTVAERVIPTVTTFDPFPIEQFSAQLRGNLNDPKGMETNVGFEYGTDISYGNTTWEKVTFTPGIYEKEIEGLTPNTTYHVRAIAENETGTGYGLDWAFTTLKPTEGFEIILPNETLLEDAAVWASEVPEEACTYFNFQIRNNAYTGWHAWYTVSVVSGDTLYSGMTPELQKGDMSVVFRNTICALPGGLPVGAHEIRVEVGTYGGEATDDYTETLTVVEYKTPIVYTERAESTTLTSATLVGTLKESPFLTSVGFEYGLVDGTTAIGWCSEDITGGEFKLDVSNLEGNETYRFRAVAKIEETVSYGEELTFEAVPAVITPLSLGWGLEDARPEEYNAHFNISYLSETKRYRIALYGGKGYEFARLDPVTGLKEVEIKANISIDDFESYGYEIHCGVYDLDTGEWLLITDYLVSPLTVTVNMTQTIETGGIPMEMETRTDTPFTFIVDNNSTVDLGVDVFLTFKGVSVALDYPHDIIGLEPSGGGYILPGSGVVVWDDAYVAKNPILIRAGESGSYTLVVWLPDEAVPSGEAYAEYTIHTKVGVYT